MPIRPQPVPAPAPVAPRGFGGGLPPPDPNAGDGGSFEKRDAVYWAARPLAPGSYTFDAYLSKIVWWLDGGIGLTLRVVQWDRTANRSGEHHGRDIRFDQTPGKRTGGAYNRWRAELVGAYTAGGWPEDQWPKDEAGNPAPPWHDFWVWQAHDGLAVPVMLSVSVAVTPPSDRGSSFVNVKKVSRILAEVDRPFQAPLPYELPQPIAEYHRWPFGDPKPISKDGRHLATVVPISKDCVPLGHLGLPTYKDL